jgi:hypothetical protein
MFWMTFETRLSQYTMRLLTGMIGRDGLAFEPQRESGVYALLVQLCTLKPSLFPFEIVDYDTHSGIDVIVKG